MGSQQRPLQRFGLLIAAGVDPPRVAQPKGVIGKAMPKGWSATLAAG